MLLADRGYDADWIRSLATEKGAWANIPPRSNRNDPICFSPYLYRARNLVEQFFNKIKHCRRVATRYDRLAATGNGCVLMRPHFESCGSPFSIADPLSLRIDRVRCCSLLRNQYYV